MSELVLRTLVDEDYARSILQAKAPGMEVISARLRHHPFAGFIFDVSHLAGRVGRTHALVDYFTGKAFISDPWQTADPSSTMELNPVQDPRWNTIDFETARQKAKSLLATAALRRARLAWKGGVREHHSVNKVWKPNWVIEAKLDGKSYRIMVDGLNGGYFFIDN
ncbi:hypothetical protein [Glutamicibacter arilaitensis]|uniref:hypothetical protein n=1 Tax=Glutamicibacter arilaitensis TaxID=256701 RepID=UPI00384A8415